ncbi:alkaline phosphatase family protein [Polycladomyces subterraneus]|uniref:Alkaline phosphatase family protein n=1 Tax=Polycladomyces subterraneus TaxID=1016997 RepID=A0ABT8IL04_9BACL|nr:alkaline phosphatase family protein [Polycladomyces subterraneus]MDN4593457.1 alkaline phosphatase family protein [Polycladomyces subterraneus]
MKKASRIEKIAARCWNVLNEGKPFTPVFVVGGFVLYQALWGTFDARAVGWALLLAVPLFAVIYRYDFPLHLRWYLWPPVVLYIGWLGGFSLGLQLWGMGWYFFFTVIFWGTIYYHLRIGIPLDNYKRFWRLVLKNSDSTSGNAQEQIPKIVLLLAYLHSAAQSPGNWQAALGLLGFTAGFALYAYAVHRAFFDWRPEEPEQFTSTPLPKHPPARRVILVVIDGCRKDRLEEADTPFLDWLKRTGTEYTRMETIYPARTVVCFSTMFTGAYPRDHGITSNMVWKLGVRCESVFDKLREVGKTGRLLGIAHLVDAFGDDVDTVTAVMKNDEADAHIMARARQIIEEKQPDLLAVQLIATDQTGHSRGPLYEEYREKIEEADRHIQSFYQWLKEKNYLEDTLFIVCADHGQSDGIGGHAHLDEGERFVPFILHGSMVREGHRVEALCNLTSVTPTICYALGASYPNRSRGPVLMEAWKPEACVSKSETDSRS